jgi:hypothetical protein
MLDRLDEITQDIYRKYRPALKAIGVDFAREDVREAIINCDFDMESVFQSAIEYWVNLQKNHQKIDYPSALLIQGLNNHWQPINWREVLSTGAKISLRIAKLRGWDWVLQYARESVLHGRTGRLNSGGFLFPPEPAPSEVAL